MRSGRRHWRSRCLARGAVRSPLQYMSLVFGVLFAVAFGWAWLPPEMPAPWLHRIVVAIVALAATMVVYGLGLAKLLRRENEWTRAAQRLVPLLAVIAAVLLVGVLGDRSGGICRRAAGADRLAGAAWRWRSRWSDWRWRRWWRHWCRGAIRWGFRNAAGRCTSTRPKCSLALTFLHIRVTMPWLFSGWFLQFWPLVVMVIAFVGVGLGEFFQRRRQNVLSEPLTTTGALLPLLPALGFWVQSSEVHYSLLLLTIGVLYAAVSALRKSFWFAVLAALAANGSLWYLLAQPRRAEHRRASAAVADSAGAVRACGRLHQPRAALAGAIGGAALRLGDRDLRLVDGRHFHQRRGRRTVAAGGARGLVDPGRVRGHLAARAGVSCTWASRFWWCRC